MFAGRKEQEHEAAVWGASFELPISNILDAMDQPDDHEAVLTGSEANFREAISKLLGTAETMGRQADDGINAADTALDPLDDPLTTAYIQQLFDNGLVSQQRLDDSFTSVRSAEDGNYAVSKKALHEAEKAILKTGKKLVEASSINLEHYGVAFILIAEGVPSLNLLGTESAFEIAAALRGMSHTTSIPTIEELYAHLICSKVHAVLGDKLGSSICYTEDIPPINFIIYMTGVSLDTMPFDLPYINKSALGLSPSRLNHGDNGYVTGFKPGCSLTFAEFDMKSTTFVVDPWSVNSAVRGPHPEQLKTIATLGRDALAWCTTGAGAEAGSTFGIVEGFLSADQQIFLLNSFRGIINRHEHLQGDTKIMQTLQALEKICETAIAGDNGSEMDWETSDEKD